MDIIKLSLIVIALTLHVAVADNGLQDTLQSGLQVDLIDQFSSEDSDHETYQKRHLNRAYLTRDPTHVNGKTYNQIRLKARPFSRYGPPRTSVLLFKRPSPQHPNEHPNSGFHQQPRKHPYDDSAVPGKIQTLEVPSPIRDIDFKDEDPIASQNNEPFRHNVANYLPPKNQQLPGFMSFHVFQRQQPTHLPHNQRYNTNHNVLFKGESMNQDTSDHSQISDATYFLIKNAEALSKLYETPVMNLNYPPFEDIQGSNEQLQKLGTLSSIRDQSGRLTHAPDLPQSIPSYASGISNALPMNTFHAQEPRKIMMQFQTSGALRNAPENRLQSNKRIKFCGDHQNTLKNVKLASSDDWNRPSTSSNNASPTDVSAPSAPSIPTAASTIPHSHVLDLRPQGNTPSTVFPYLQYPSPLFGTSFNLPNHIPSYGIAVGGSSIYPGGISKDSSPTHFGLPLPTIASGQENTLSIQPVFSIIPTGTSQGAFPSYPAYGIQPA